MTIKRVLESVLLLSVILTTEVSAELPAVGEGQRDALITGAADVTFLTGYLWHGMLRNDEPVFQPSITMETFGLAFNIWGNYDFTDNVSEEAPGFTEVDYTLSYGRDFDLFSFSMGYSRYAYSHVYIEKVDADNTVLRQRLDETQLAFVYVEHSDLDVVPSLTVEYDVSGDNTLYAAVALAYERVIAETLSVEVTTSLAWANASYHRDWLGTSHAALSDAALGTRLIWNPTDPFVVTLSLRYSYFVNETISDVAEACAYDSPDALVGGLTLSYRF